jgi:hypothetical protein
MWKINPPEVVVVSRVSPQGHEAGLELPEVLVQGD